MGVFKRIVAACLVFLTVMPVGCGAKTKRPAQDVIEELVMDYATYEDSANARVEELLKELDRISADLGSRWRRITEIWKAVNSDLSLNYGVLPDGLPDTDELCIVALGFQLEPDGSLREELVERLRVVLKSAEKYPNAYIICTGGGTAAENEEASEAGEMAKWLISNGIDKKRVIVEDNSVTTAQNAIFCYDILSTQYPDVRYLAIVSSDYHIATGELLFETENILRASTAGGEKYEMISKAAYKAPSGSLSTTFQAGALIELSGDTKTAFDIYYENYDIHELPPLN